MRSVLQVRDLSVSFSRRGHWSTAVNAASFDIAANETLALVGESGSGKSVTSMAIMRLLDPQLARVSGKVILDGVELLGLPERKMREVRGNQVSMIFQEPMTSLNPVLTAGEQVVEALMVHSSMGAEAARAEALRLFERVRIPAAKSRLSEYPHQFSGGMRQRIMIAMALALKPKLLIADEPTTALDVTIQAQIISLLKEIQREDHMSILFITHDMGVVAEIADRTLVMFRGNVVEENSTQGIFDNPKDPYTRALLAAVPRLGSMHGTDQPREFDIIDPLTGQPEKKEEQDRIKSPIATPLLEVHNLVTRYDIRGGWRGKVLSRIHAVENVSLSVAAGETVSLVGESGCGKSTLGNSISRLLTPVAGKVLLDGRNLLELGDDEMRQARKDIQVIFQDPFASLNPRMTVGDAIAEPVMLHEHASRQSAGERVRELLVQVGLDPSMANRYPHEFSGGQRQRICIARALASRPKLIIADECVSALDVSVKAQVVNLMMKLQRDLNLSYVFISHDMAVVERISHRVAVMYLGEIVEIGPRSAVFENPQHPYTKRLLATVPVPDPSRLHMKRTVETREIKSPVRAPDYISPTREYTEVTPGHFVQSWGPEWMDAAA